jgi:hypothetical protein
MAPTLTEQDFLAEAKAFLDANAKPRGEQRTAWGEGTDRVGIFPEKTPEQEQAEVADAKAWRTRVFDAGFGWITGPSQYGGRELPGSYERAWQAVVAKYDVPSGAPFGIGLGMIAPTILAHATDAAKERYLRALYRGDMIAASCSVSRARGPTWPGCRPGPCATATSGWSPARRCGRPGRSTPTSARSSAAPTPTSPSTRASPGSSSTCTRPVSKCDRCGR